MRIGIVRYCLKGHWDDNGAPIYIGRPPFRQLQKLALVQKNRLESVKFCLICGSELLSACQECGAPLHYGIDDDPPQHCGGCGKPFPWTANPVAVEAAPVEEPEESITARVISAPVGRVKGFRTWAHNALVKFGPSAGRMVSKVATDYVEKKIGL